MFTIPIGNIIKSDEGFSVQIFSRAGLKYTQNNNSLLIDSEMLMGDYDIVIWAMSIKQWDSGAAIDENTKNIILDNVIRALTWRGLKVKVEYQDLIFTKLKPNVIESNKGFAVEYLGQTQLKYTQNSKSVVINTEKSAEPNTIFIKVRSIRLWDSGELIDAITKSLIMDNIGVALHWDGINLVEIVNEIR